MKKSRTELYQEDKYEEIMYKFAQDVAPYVFKKFRNYGLSDYDSDDLNKIVKKHVQACMDLQRADAEDNSNPNHGEEQGAPF